MKAIHNLLSMSLLQVVELMNLYFMELRMMGYNLNMRLLDKRIMLNQGFPIFYHSL